MNYLLYILKKNKKNWISFFKRSLDHPTFLNLFFCFVNTL